MKKSWVVLGAIVLVIVVLASSLMSTYNSLVVMSENVDNSWAQVQVQLQRRYDLIGNLVETVKGFATQEREVLGRIADARASWKNTPQGSTEQQVAAANQADNTMGAGAVGRLLVIVENYPQLASSQQFTGLRDELTGTENRVAVSRQRYNDQVRLYNQTVRSFPTVILARLFGYGQRSYYQPSAGSEQAPQVKF
ncbi:MAG: LemA family protein [Symbiobacteriia bacterium]